MRTRVLSVRTAAIAVASAVIVVAVLAVALGWLLQLRASDDATRRARSELRSTAGTVVAQVFSVSQASWHADRARARALVGGAFATSHAVELSGPPDAALRSIAWFPDAVGIIDATADHGDVVVRATVRTTPAAGTPVVERRSVTAELDRTGGHWVLTGVEVLQ